jgi:hypothetical protein
MPLYPLPKLMVMQFEMSDHIADCNPPDDEERPPKFWAPPPDVDVFIIKINVASNFGIRRHALNNVTVHNAIFSVAKHIRKGLYRLVSLNASERSCVMVISTTFQNDDPTWKEKYKGDLPEEL